MTLASMTGFASAAGALGPIRWTWELKTVNARGLDIRVRVPPGWDAAEGAARSAIAGRLARGTCYATLAVAREAGGTAVRINEQALEAVAAALALLRGRIDAAPPSLDGILAIRGVVEVVEPEEDEAARAAQLAGILASLEEALEALVGARLGEGAALRSVLTERLDQIARLQQAAADSPIRQPEAIRRRLEEQIRALLDQSATLDPDRLHQEAVLLATKADVREELDRIVAHVAAARTLLDQGGPVGRRLDFLAQELGRESNTLCAKSNDVALTAIGLDLKTVVEQFREQVQNLE